MLCLLSALVKAEPMKIEGLEILECAVVASAMEKNGYEWRYVQGEMFKSGIVGCEIMLEKNNHRILVRGTIINGVFTVLQDKMSWLAEGDGYVEDSTALV